ncbi:unnamed protein product, partial [Parascedosporium putredinis]
PRQRPPPPQGHPPIHPRHGWSYFTSRFLGPNARDFQARDWPFEIMFTYGGSLQQLEAENGILEQLPIPGRALDCATSDIGPNVGRIALFEVSTMIDQGVAKVKFLYNKESRHQSRIGAWISNYEHLLLEAIGRLRYRAQELTLADVPLLNVTYDGIAKLNSDRLMTLNIASARDIESVYPATALQQEILVAQCLSPNAYNLHALLELAIGKDNAVDPSKICTAWQQTVAKYPALRTVFIESVSEDGLFDAVVLRKCSPEMLFIEAGPADNAELSLNTLPPLKPSKSEPRHRLSHRKDCVRPQALLRLQQGLPKNLDLSYPRYIESLRAVDAADDLEYWTDRLQTSKPCLFPALWSGNNAEGKWQTTTLKLGVSAADLDAFCHPAAVKRATVLRVAWGLLLRAYTGDRKVCFGFRHSGRDLSDARLAGITEAVGGFETELVCSMDLPAHKSLDSVNALGLKGKHLYNTTLSFLDEPKGLLKSKFSTGRAHAQLGCSMYFTNMDKDISVCVMVRDGQLQVTLSHRILTGVQGEGIAHAFGCAIRAVLGSPNGSVGGIDLFSSRDMAQLPAAITSAVDGGKTVTPAKAVHELVEAVAKARPEAPAIAAWDGQLSYRQMAKLVGRLARHLVKLGVAPGLPVPVILGKSRWSAVAILAVLKAGGCFVPLDEDDESLTRKVIRQTSAKIVLAMDMRAKRLEATVESLVVVNDGLFSASLLDEEACPKAALSAAFTAQGPALDIGPASRVLQLSSFASDTSLSEVLTTLVHGGCLCVPSDAERSHDLVGAVERLQVDWMYITPVLARRLKPAQVPSVRTVCFRTRHLDEDTFERWSGQSKILLSYGTSDICPLGISVIEANSAEQLSSIAPPFIGKFWIVNPEDHRHLMPIGAVGELVIESPTLAYKLMRNATPLETLRAQQVVSDDGLLKMRFFKTGHRVRYMNDGTMALISHRRDGLSHDGNVIPVPEVEQHLRRCLGIDVEVVVDTVVTADGARVLAAFIELGEHFDGTEDLAALSGTSRERAFMAKRLIESYMNTTLPSYMMPPPSSPCAPFPSRPRSRFTAASSKRCNPEGIQTVQIKPLPLTQVEERVRAIWAQLLHINPESISAAQSFLRLGGDAHLAARLVVACREQGLSIRLSDVLRNASLTDLCQTSTLSEDPSAGMYVPDADFSMSPDLVAALQHIRLSVAPCAGIEESRIVDVALATCTQIRALESNLRGARAGINHVVLNFSGFVDYKKIESACAELVRAHPILRTCFVAHDRRVYQVVTTVNKERLVLKVNCPGRRLQSAIEKITKKDEAYPVSLSTLVTKFTFVDAGKHSALLIRLSTAQYDEASLPLLLHDLKRIYSSSQTTTLRRPSFADFARQARAARSQAAIDHWTTLLQGAHMTQVIAHSKPQKASMTPRTVTRAVAIPSAAIAELGITFDTVLKSAWAIVLATLAGTSDVTFGEVIDGRHVRMPEANGVAGVLGPLDNIIPVRVRFPDAPSTPLDLLRCVHEQRLASIPYENTGMYDIVEKCTSWPYWSRFSTVVQHRYRDGLGEAQRFNIGGATCSVAVAESPYRDLHDLLHRVPVSFVELAMAMLASAIESLTSLAAMSEPSVPSGVHLYNTARQVPLPQLDFDPAPTPQSHLLSPSDLLLLQTTIATAWNDLLDPAGHGVPEPHLPTASFYDLWGSLVPAHLLAARLTADLANLDLSVEDLCITTDEVVDNPSQLKQLELLARKIRDAQSRGHRNPAALLRGIRRLSIHTRSGASASSPSTTNFAASGSCSHLAVVTSARSGGNAFVSPIGEEAEMMHYSARPTAITTTVVADHESTDSVSPLSPLGPLPPFMLSRAEGLSSAGSSPSTPHAQSKGIMRKASRALERMSRLGSIHYGAPVVPSSA